MCKQTLSPLPSVDRTSITTVGLFHGSLRRKRWIDRGQRSLLKSEKPVVDTILVLELPKTRCFMCSFERQYFQSPFFFLSVRMFSFCFFCKKPRCCYFCFTAVDKFQNGLSLLKTDCYSPPTWKKRLYCECKRCCWGAFIRAKNLVMLFQCSVCFGNWMGLFQSPHLGPKLKKKKKW